MSRTSYANFIRRSILREEELMQLTTDIGELPGIKVLDRQEEERLFFEGPSWAFGEPLPL